jgi:hypothetical protein
MSGKESGRVCYENIVPNYMLLSENLAEETEESHETFRS